MSEGSGDSVEIYRARDLTEADALCTALERAGISSHIDNELLQGASGAMLAGWAAAPRVLVASTDEAAARAVLDGFLLRAGGTEEAEDGSLHCLACGAAMNQASACPECGWSYGPDPDAAPESAGADDEIEAETLGREEFPTPEMENVAAAPALPGSAIWGEVGAVLAVGVVPHIVTSMECIAVPVVPPVPFWFDALRLTVMSGCTTFVTLYLIHRSGEPWKRFGLARLSLWDVLLGMELFLAAWVLWLFCCSRVPWDGGPASADSFPRPESLVDYALLVLMWSANGFAEELVTRAYLVTRFEQLLRSRVSAVLWSAALFAVYHGYQGIAGVASAMSFGVMYGAAFLLIRRVWPLALGHALYGISLYIAG